MQLTVNETRLRIGGVEDVYGAHQQVWKLFGNGFTERPFIYRADPIPGEDGQWFIHVRTDSNIESPLKVTPKTYNVACGTRYAFAVKCVPMSRNGRKCVEIPRNQAAAEWFHRRSEQHGFVVEDVHSAESRGLIFRGKNGRRITLNDTLIRGILTVTDSDRFSKVVTDGFGRHRGFGFGLVQLTEI